MSRLFYLMGKSASGKDSLYTELMRAFDFHRFSPYTTRPMRQGETEGIEYHFSDRIQFERFQKAGKVIESRTYDTVQGPWTYFTVDDGFLDDERNVNYLGIGTLESYLALAAYFGHKRIVPLYIEVEDGIRLERALNRERAQAEPQYQEMCRRFLADSADFSEEKLLDAGIIKRFTNDDFEKCKKELTEYIKKLCAA